MTDIQSTGGKCPSCGSPISNYNKASTDYGTPIRTCKRCGQPYLDRRYRELAFEEPWASDLKASTGVKTALMGLFILAVSVGFNLLTLHFRGYYYKKMAFVSILSLLVIGYGIFDAVRVKTGAKAKIIEKKRADSEQRLSDRAYAQQLADLGYNVPDKYL